ARAGGRARPGRRRLACGVRGGEWPGPGSLDGVVVGRRAGIVHRRRGRSVCARVPGVLRFAHGP
ncbi:MAG TPA: hypothetical protein VHG90_16235, partial [Acidimicrobiales bacterium]|nr:hypothetical protein [Acidimicrobiales bacterium]